MADLGNSGVAPNVITGFDGLFAKPEVLARFDHADIESFKIEPRAGDFMEYLGLYQHDAGTDPFALEYFIWHFRSRFHNPEHSIDMAGIDLAGMVSKAHNFLIMLHQPDGGIFWKGHIIVDEKEVGAAVFNGLGC